MTRFCLICLFVAWSLPAHGASDADETLPPSHYAASLLNFINSYRIQHGMPALMPADRLVALAREHSQYMAERGDISHDQFDARYDRSRRLSCVENVGWNYRDPYDQFKGWQNSAGHNAAMLDPKVTLGGIAVFDSYVTFFACS